MKVYHKLFTGVFLFTVVFINYTHYLKFDFGIANRSLTDGKYISEYYGRIAYADSKAFSPEITVKKRTNVLLLGIEGNERADTIILLSYERSENRINMISIPRDTYYHEKNHNNGDQRKINAEYGRGKEAGCVDAVSRLLCGIPIDYYISIDYEGVERIVNIIQGVEIDIPFDMEVGGIRLKEGKQLLMGYEALQYVRFRKKYPDGDLGRIKAQHKFAKAVVGKLGYSNMPDLIIESFKSIRTNMTLTEMLEYAKCFKNNSLKEVNTYILPGTAMYKHIGGYNWSYFFHSPEKTDELIREVYWVKSVNERKRKHWETY